MHEYAAFAQGRIQAPDVLISLAARGNLFEHHPAADAVNKADIYFAFYAIEAYYQNGDIPYIFSKNSLNYFLSVILEK